jgi:teichuronic acid biosynthesis glycosyltransferase TuaC
MKVLWTHNFNPKVLNSGNFMFNLADFLRKKGIEIELYYMGNMKSLWNIYRAQSHLQKISMNYDIVHAQYGSACSLATSFVKDVPKVLSLRGSDWYRYNFSFGYTSIHGLLATLMTKLSIKKFDAIVPVSERMAKDISLKFPNLKLFVFPSPINLDVFKFRDIKECRKSLGFENNSEFWVLFTTVHTTNPTKRVRLAEEAVEIASKLMGGNVKIRIASGIPHDQMPLFVSSCDVILCTSTHEGWPNSIKEALAANIPFVSTDVSDLRLIADKENSCRICPPDAEIIANNICEVLTQSKDHNLGQYVVSMDLEKTSERILCLYKELLSS